jgi:hypothetical protein
VVTKTGLTNLIEVVTKAGLTNLIEVVTKADKYLVSLTHYPDCEPISLCSYC